MPDSRMATPAEPQPATTRTFYPSANEGLAAYAFRVACRPGRFALVTSAQLNNDRASAVVDPRSNFGTNPEIIFSFPRAPKDLLAIPLHGRRSLVSHLSNGLWMKFRIHTNDTVLIMEFAPEGRDPETDG